MNGQTHIAVASTTAVGALWLLSGGRADVVATGYVAVAGASALGALVPDIDHPQSMIGNRLPFVMFALGFAVLVMYWANRLIPNRGQLNIFGPMFEMLRPVLGWAWLRVAIGVATLAISIVASTSLTHRGPTHSLVVGAALTLVASIVFAILPLPWWLGLCFGWGYLSHLLTDMLTPMGCPSLLWPWIEGERV